MNFKRHISIFLVLFILLVNSSASLVLHYCHDQIASISLVYQENKVTDTIEDDSCCAADDKSDEKSCCSDEEIKVDKKIEYSILKGFQFKVLAVTFENKMPSFINEVDVLSINKKVLDYYCDSNSPPFYKLYSQLIFYA
jgi:hypothetical protein